MARQSEKIDPVVETEIRAEIDSLAERYTKRADLTREAATLLFLRYGIYPSATVVHSYTRLGSLTDINSDLKNFWQRMEDGGRKSFRREELKEEFYLPKQGGFLVPYLEGIQQDLKMRD